MIIADEISMVFRDLFYRIIKKRNIFSDYVDKV